MTNLIICSYHFSFLKLQCWWIIFSIITVSLNYIQEIQSDRGTWKINAKVIHMREYKERDVTTSIHLILVDKKGTFILVSMGKFTMLTHFKSCVLGKSYFFAKFRVNPVAGKYRSTKHEWNTFFYKTSITEDVCWSKISLRYKYLKIRTLHGFLS